MNHAAHRCVSGQLVPLRRLSVLIGHGVPPGYPSRMVAEPSWYVSLARAFIYGPGSLGCTWNRLYTTIMPSSRRASPIESTHPPSPHFDTFYTIRNSVSPVDFIIFCFNQWNSIERSRDFCSRNFIEKISICSLRKKILAQFISLQVWNNETRDFVSGKIKIIYFYNSTVKRNQNFEKIYKMDSFSMKRVAFGNLIQE